jgi:hypothetical protein
VHQPVFIYWVGRLHKLPLAFGQLLQPPVQQLFQHRVHCFIVPRNQPLRRRLHRPYESPSAPEWQADRARAPQDRSPVPSPPQRDLRDPAPTVAVAYRIIKRGVPHQNVNHFESEGTDQPVREPVPSRVSNPPSQQSTEDVGSDWGDDPDRDW